jgi:hypothetical protein
MVGELLISSSFTDLLEDGYKVGEVINAQLNRWHWNVGTEFCAVFLPLIPARSTDAR